MLLISPELLQDKVFFNFTWQGLMIVLFFFFFWLIFWTLPKLQPQITTLFYHKIK